MNYSGKKKRHTIKAQVVVDKVTRTVICTAFVHGKCHDFKLYQKSKVRLLPKILLRVDSGYQGIQKQHAHTILPIKGSKLNKLTKQDKRDNQATSSERVTNEHAIGFLKRFKIISDRYRNRRKRFGLRFNLIAGICNLEVS
jgi:hypothetical protein